MDKQCNCWQITFEPLKFISQALEDFLGEYFDVISINYTEDELEEYVGYISPDFDKENFEKKAKEKNLKLPPYRIEKLENKNWLKESVIQFDPIEVEDFLIYGIHEKETPETEKIAIKIFAATAFGSSHQTTRGCLDSISYLNKLSVEHQNILDMGTGSGILSLACAKLWNDSKVTAVDIDPESVRVTRQNAIDNDISSISTEVSDGYQSEIVIENAPYDIIISNILARPLIEMKEDLYKYLKEGGHCILSGFNIDQEEWVIGSHEALGLELIKLYEIDNWCAAIMRKN